MSVKRVRVGSEVQVIGPTKQGDLVRFLRSGRVTDRTRRALTVAFSDGRTALFARDSLKAL